MPIITTINGIIINMIIINNNRITNLCLQRKENESQKQKRTISVPEINVGKEMVIITDYMEPQQQYENITSLNATQSA